MPTRCVHGIDSRFCANCNRSAAGRSSAAVGDVTLAEIVEFLNHEQVRATYSAVGGVLGVIPRSVGAALGPHSVEASWIVSAGNGLPTDYSAEDMHPALTGKDDIISSPLALTMRLAAWKARKPE